MSNFVDSTSVSILMGITVTDIATGEVLDEFHKPYHRNQDVTICQDITALGDGLMVKTASFSIRRQRRSRLAQILLEAAFGRPSMLLPPKQPGRCPRRGRTAGKLLRAVVARLLGRKP